MAGGGDVRREFTVALMICVVSLPVTITSRRPAPRSNSGRHGRAQSPGSSGRWKMIALVGNSMEETGRMRSV
jgi:hypothetical protein